MLARCWQRARGVRGTERWPGGHGRRSREERSEGPGEPVWSGPGAAGKEFALFSEMGMSVKSSQSRAKLGLTGSDGEQRRHWREAAAEAGGRLDVRTVMKPRLSDGLARGVGCEDPAKETALRAGRNVGGRGRPRTC